MMPNRYLFTSFCLLGALLLFTSQVRAQAFEQSFDQQDGAAEDWTVYSGTWQVLDGALNGASAGEAWSWAGNPPMEFPPTYELFFDMEFINRPGDGVGRHGGIMFCATSPTQRYDTGTSGYELDWIDRQSDHGLRLIRVDNGLHTMLGTGGSFLADPPTEWQIVIDLETIEIWGDGELLMEVVDGTHRGGHLGCWAWSNNQLVAYDNFILESPETSVCFSMDPRTGSAPLEVSFDASCTISDAGIESYEWDFGDGQSGEGEQATHVYEIPDNYVVTLTVTDTDGETYFSENTVTVFEVVDYYEESFDLDDGPLEDWMVVSGDWRIDTEALRITTPGPPESWAWIGAEPTRFGNVQSINFRLEFLSRPADGIGRHGGVFFFAQNASPRFAGNSGYSVDWIDRTQDQGYRISVWNNGRETALAPSTGDIEPGENWTIEFDDETLWLIVDGEIKAEVFDSTWRTGHIGFWSYTNNQDFEIDDIVIGESGGSENCTNDQDDDGDGDVDCDDEDCMDREFCIPSEICGNNIDDDRDGAADCDDSDCSETADCVVPVGTRLVRGDANSDGSINLTDGVIPLLYLFSGGAEPTCMDAADTNDTGAIEITDAIIVFSWLFSGGDAPASPSPTSPGYLTTDCGEDATDDGLGCESPAATCE